MDFDWMAFALNDFLWIGLTFVLGLMAQKIGLPPLVGFLMAGFVLSTQKIVDHELLKTMADLGITRSAVRSTRSTLPPMASSDRRAVYSASPAVELFG